MDKAIQYAQLHNPYVINNLHMQYDIQDRRKVYSTLQAEGIEIPRYAVLDRDSPNPKGSLVNWVKRFTHFEEVILGFQTMNWWSLKTMWKLMGSFSTNRL